MTETDAWHRAVAAAAAAAGADWAAPLAPDPAAAWRAETAHLAAVAVAGSDSRGFLEAQLSCRVPEAGAGSAQPGAWCNPQGRVVSTLVVVPAAPAGYLLLLPAALAESLAGGLARYVLRARVSVDPLPAMQPRFGVCGARDALAAATGVAPPAAPWAISGEESGMLVAMPGPAPRWLALAAADTAAGWWQALEGITGAHDQGLWRHLDIDAGWPWLDTATSERFVPQALALDRGGAVSFDKGCYPGQEIVARIHYRGRASQRLAGIAGMGPPPPPGTRLLAPGESRAAGRVLDAVAAPGGRHHGLAVVAADCAAGTRLCPETDDAAATEVQPWPQLD